jgi:hypothetical protein
MAIPGPDPLVNLGDHVREVYRADFRARVAAGTVRPFSLPYDLVGSFILPALYLSIPHTRRPWLYRARFLVFAAVVLLNLRMMGEASSINVAPAYAVGLMGAWGILWSATLLLWTRPQFDAERVQRRRRRRRESSGGDANRNAWHESNGDTLGASKRPVRAREKGRRLAAENQSQASPDETVARALADGYEYHWEAFPA